MKRTDKYKNTDVFTFYNANPKARLTTDCVIRAISTALEIPYINVLRDLLSLQIYTGYDIADTRLYDQYLKKQGWIKMPQPKKDDKKKYTGVEWCKFLQYWNNDRYNKMIAHIGNGHIVAIKDGKIFDTWDSSEGCIGNYWIKGI